MGANVGGESLCEIVCWVIIPLLRHRPSPTAPALACALRRPATRAEAAPLANLQAPHRRPDTRVRTPGS